jgi:hypothetical protein
MNILDHRILVPKSPQVVWEVLSDLSKNPTWQVNYSTISFLTSRHTGSGVRWRYTTTTGREYVAETTAWYDGLGYEYILVDGVQFRENKGRIRLQEIAEGTIVQWTFSYDVGGVLGGVRNALTYKRQFEPVMVDSLKMLWRVMHQAQDESSREAKSILREGLNYEARAQYKPRHPSTKADSPATEPNIQPIIVEPPISDDDTRPRAPVVTDVPAAAEQAEEPMIMVEFQRPVAADDIPFVLAEQTEPTSTQEHAKAIVEGAVVADVVEVIPSSIVLPEIQLSDNDDLSLDLIKPPGVLPEQPVIVEIIATDAPVLPEMPVYDTPSEIKEVVAETAAPWINEDITQKPDAPAPKVDVSKPDTAGMSVFDVFGLPKPSETQEIRPVVTASEPIRPTVEAAAVVLPTKSVRTGLRLMLRRKHVRVRRPG